MTLIERNPLVAFEDGLGAKRGRGLSLAACARRSGDAIALEPGVMKPPSSYLDEEQRALVKMRLFRPVVMTTTTRHDASYRTASSSTLGRRCHRSDAAGKFPLRYLSEENR